MENNFSGYEACKIWCAAKAHYTSDSYDVIKYNWSFKLDEDTFIRRKDRFTFERLAREYGDEVTFKRAVGYYLYCNPKGVCRGLVRPNPDVNAALDRIHWSTNTFRKNYRTGYTIDYIYRDVAEGTIDPEFACMYLDFFLGPNFVVPDNWKKIRKCALLPKYNAVVGYSRKAVADVMNTKPSPLV
jgi:hypothetical protein